MVRVYAPLYMCFANQMVNIISSSGLHFITSKSTVSIFSNVPLWPMNVLCSQTHAQFWTLFQTHAQFWTLLQYEKAGRVRYMKSYNIRIVEKNLLWPGYEARADHHTPSVI